MRKILENLDVQLFVAIYVARSRERNLSKKPVSFRDTDVFIRCKDTRSLSVRYVPGVFFRMYVRDGLSRRRPLDHTTGQGMGREKHEGKPLNAKGFARASNNTIKGEISLGTTTSSSCHGNQGKRQGRKINYERKNIKLNFN